MMIWYINVPFFFQKNITEEDQPESVKVTFESLCNYFRWADCRCTNTDDCEHPDHTGSATAVCFLYAVTRIQVAFSCSHLKELLQTLTSAPYCPSWRRCCWWQQERWCHVMLFTILSSLLMSWSHVSICFSVSHLSVRGYDGGWEWRSQQDSVAVLVLGSAG